MTEQPVRPLHAIFASDHHPFDTERHHLEYGYWSPVEYDGRDDPAGVRYVLGAEFDRVKGERELLLKTAREVHRLTCADRIHTKREVRDLVERAIAECEAK